MADGAAAALMCTSASQTFLTLISCPDLKAGLRRCTPLPRAVRPCQSLQQFRLTMSWADGAAGFTQRLMPWDDANEQISHPAGAA